MSDIQKELDALLEGESVSDHIGGVLHEFVDTFGWERVLNDLATIAEQRSEGRVYGVIKRATQFLFPD
jgi:hypothetical protein